MKRLAIAIAATFTAIAPAAFAQYDRPYDNRDDRARVIDVQKVADASSGQHEECWNPRAGHYEEVRNPDDHHDKNNVAGTVIGGVLGGVLGHQVGSGRGNTAATVGGAALGAYAGNRVENNRAEEKDSQPDLDRSRCRVVGAGADAYDVRYSFQGREYVARMDHDPGRFLERGRDINSDGTPY
jgi:uncharacterized protein YcfJ